jgi:hypothetical protein
MTRALLVGFLGFVGLGALASVDAGCESPYAKCDPAYDCERSETYCPSEGGSCAPYGEGGFGPREAPECSITADCTDGRVCSSRRTCVAPPLRIFVSSTRVAGDLAFAAGASDAGDGGGSRGDATCAALAVQARLGGSWVAWLSEQGRSIASIVDRLSEGPRFLVDGHTQVFPDKASLTEPGGLMAAITLDETGHLGADAPLAWTTLSSPPLGSGTGTCTGWSTASPADQGAVTTAATGDAWLTGSGARPCSETHPIVCIER